MKRKQLAKKMLALLLSGTMVLGMGADVFASETDADTEIPVETDEVEISLASDEDGEEETEIIDSGTCGDDLSWTLSSDYVLTISGTGEMTDWSLYNKVPWYSSYSRYITQVVIENGVTSISADAFYGCTSMTDVAISDSIITIGEDAFYFCSSLTDVTIPDSVTSIANNAFRYCTGLTTITVDKDNIVYSSLDGVLFNKDQTELICCPGGIVGSYVIPDSVTCIGAYAFYDCVSLTGVTIPEGVESIGEWTFAYTNMTNITIPDSVTAVGSFAFAYSGLTGFTIPDSITTIESDTFFRCKSLASVNISDSVTSIGESAFNSCSNLVSIDIPDSVITIDANAFANCSNLTSVNIPDGVLYIRNYAFYKCSDLISVVIPNSVVYLGSYVFYGCTSLSSVIISDSVTYIRRNAFESCTSLTSVAIPENVKTIDYRAFFGCTGLTNINIPDKVETVGDSAFYGCTGLIIVIIPDSVTTIKNKAFYNCTSLTRVIMGNGVTDIYYDVFYNCPDLTDVYYTGSESDWSAIAIDEDNTCLTNATIHYNYDPSVIVDISNFTVSLSDIDYTYDGMEKIPTVTVMDAEGIVVEDSNYTVSYSNNINPGTATVTIIGTGDYIGTITETFTIEAASISSYTVMLSSTSYTYDGTAKTPTVTVKDVNGTTLSSTNYIVTYSDNTNAGTATVIITGIDNYTGTITETFTIEKASQSVTATVASTSIKAGNTTTITASGIGTITYSSSNTSIATVDSNGEVTGKGVGTVTITVKAAGNSNYKSASKTVTVKVGLSTPTISSVTQSGSNVTIKWGKVTGASGYYIYRSTSKSSGYSLVKTISGGSTVSYKDTSSKTSGKTYYYKVVAYSGSTKSSESGVKSLKYMKGSVSSLTNISSGISVKWSKVSGATGYYIYRKSGSGSYTKVKTITSASTTSWTDTAVKSKNGTTYTYYVQPYNSSSKGAYTTKKTVRLTTVSLSSVKNSSSKKMTVKWAKNSKATGYQIQYSTSSSFSSGTKTITVTGASNVSKIISSLTKGKTYYVRIRAYKTVSGTKYYSAWSSKKSVKISK